MSREVKFVANVVKKINIAHSRVDMINKTFRDILSPRRDQNKEHIAPTIKNTELIRATVSSLPRDSATVNSCAIGVIMLNKPDAKNVKITNIFIDENLILISSLFLDLYSILICK